VVISHRHSDHTSGLDYLLEVNPDNLIYVPEEGFFFGGSLPGDFLEPVRRLPADLRYFGGRYFVGCSHPGVEKILGQAADIDERLYSVVGGFHLVRAPEPEVRRVALLLRDELKIERVAPAHCTSEPGFKVFLDLFGERFDRAGLGAKVEIPSE
jgi:7,8-dihydropterin-6-yl-methyl-4-(beta-D-ribofuranosyl)aminobenzene 5'-phosphate synthase